MKCKHCGSNLTIDTPFCPFCGRENQVAKKHREDMSRYSEDYKATKKEVLRNAAKFNLKTIRITAIAVTIAAIAFLFIIIAFNEELGYRYYYSNSRTRSAEYAPEMVELVKADEYMELNRFMDKKRLNFYSTEYKEYSNTEYLSASFNRLFGYLMVINTKNRDISSYMGNNISNEVKTIIKYSTQISDNEEVNRFYADILRDTKLLLGTYLGLSDEDLADLEKMTDGKLTLTVEEAYYAKIGE